MNAQLVSQDSRASFNRWCTILGKLCSSSPIKCKLCVSFWGRAWTTHNECLEKNGPLLLVILGLSHDYGNKSKKQKRKRPGTSKLLMHFGIYKSQIEAMQKYKFQCCCCNKIFLGWCVTTRTWPWNHGWPRLFWANGSGSASPWAHWGKKMRQRTSSMSLSFLSGNMRKSIFVLLSTILDDLHALVITERSTKVRLYLQGQEWRLT